MNASCSFCGADEGTDYCSCQRQIVRPKKLVRYGPSKKANNELAGGDYFHHESCGGQQQYKRQQQYVVPAKQPRPCQCQVCVSFPTLGSVISKWKKEMESKKLFKIHKFFDECSWDDENGGRGGGGGDDGGFLGIKSKGDKVWT